jgi:subtilisin family serine protease
MRKAIVLAIVLTFIFSVLGMDQAVQAISQPGPVPGITGDSPAGGAEELARGVQSAIGSLQAGEMSSVIVTLKPQANVSVIIDRNRSSRIEKVINALQQMANATQGPIIDLLEARAAEGKVQGYESFWVFNGLAVTASPDVIAELAALPLVASITPDATIPAPALQAAAGRPALDLSPIYAPALQVGGPPEPNLSVVNAPALWELGFRGQGVVVANMDTGVDRYHPDLASQWRGGTNSWFDPNGQHVTPTDVSGHGTRTMGVMVGRDAGGTAIGIAPEAQWIAVKIFNDQGSATVSAIHAGYQWLLDPDGNPATPDTPHVVNNSWTLINPGCDLEFQLDLRSLRAAGILPVFAAGNTGPGSGTSVSPSNNPEAFAVGATSDSDLIYVYSSRGPSACGESPTVFPEMVAPGVSIRTSDLYGSYFDATGTSLAAPHVAGALALLLSAFPDLTAADQEAVLISGVVDLGPGGADNDFGYGRLDVLAAHQWLAAGGVPTPTPTATPVPVVEMHVAGIDMAVVSDNGPWSHAEATVTVLDASGAPVGGATVAGSFSGDSSGGASGATNANGQVTLLSPQAKRGANWTWCVDDINRGGDTYALGANLETCDSITAAQPTNTPAFTPTPTTAPQPTNTPTSTPTPSPGAGVMHVGDLDGSSSVSTRRWNATITVTVHDANEAPLASATVNGTWSNGASGSDSCVTDSMGQCNLTKANIKSNVSAVTFTVDSLAHVTHNYLPPDNHDPDGDSDGTAITIVKP